jgi:splicing factor 3B subunit 4
MNGQFLMNKAISVQYAFKKDGKGERHGTAAERLLAAQARKNNALPVAARPPPAPLAFGARLPMPGFQGPYQGQFAGALAQPPPPPGFTPQQTILPPGMPMQVGGMPPVLQMGMPPPPNMYNPPGGFPPPPPPGFAPQSVPGGMMPPPPMGIPMQY